MIPKIPKYAIFQNFVIKLAHRIAIKWHLCYDVKQRRRRRQIITTTMMTMTCMILHLTPFLLLSTWKREIKETTPPFLSFSAIILFFISFGLLVHWLIDSLMLFLLHMWTKILRIIHFCIKNDLFFFYLLLYLGRQQKTTTNNNK